VPPGYSETLTSNLTINKSIILRFAGSATVTQGPASASPSPAADLRIARVREHLRRYRDLAAQGKWADAGKELEAIEAEIK